MNRILTLFVVALVLGLIVGCPGEKTNTTTNTYVVPLPVRILTSASLSSRMVLTSCPTPKTARPTA